MIPGPHWISAGSLFSPGEKARKDHFLDLDTIFYELGAISAILCKSEILWEAHRFGLRSVVHVASFCILLKRSLVFSCCVHQRYWIGITALWVYEYFLTVGDEIRYIWKAPKDNIVFCLFVLNRYLALIIITVTCVAFFSSYWTEEMFVPMVFPCGAPNEYVSSNRCLRYGYAEQLETLVMCTIAEMLVLLRVYALSGNNRTVIICAIPLIISQWGLLFYVCSQSANGTANLTLLLGPSDVPTLPDIDAFRLCISVPPLDVVPYGQAYLCLLIVYDGLAVLAILYIVAGQSDNLHLMPILKLIQRDGLLYFAVMFTSHFVWLMLTLYAPTGLQFIQNQSSTLLGSTVVDHTLLGKYCTSKTRRAQGTPRMENGQVVVEASKHNKFKVCLHIKNVQFRGRIDLASKEVLTKQISDFCSGREIRFAGQIYQSSFIKPHSAQITFPF
ncbi:hypothetical protein LENED_004920 [Lentinula edodes]|uniref:DUF6533 domain-containing protein n=1 Tax=Lentinula edodes TaxID=5353 RepID=A0A1Q3E825_LENED|nr:hypothetical protein LENED_004920 [Lentinula edodes]